MNGSFFFVIFFTTFIIYAFYKLGKISGITKSKLDEINNTLTQKEAESKSYMEDIKRINKSFHDFEGTNIINHNDASRVLSGKVIKYKNNQTKSTNTETD